MTTSAPIETGRPPTRSFRGPRWANRVALLVTAILVLGPLGYVGLRMEIAAWHAAAAQDQVWAGRHAEALQGFSAALAWDPDQADYLILRSEQHLALGEIDAALADATRAYGLAPGRARMTYADMLTRAGRGVEAAALMDRWREEVQERYPRVARELDNSVAYHLALAGTDLDRALEYIDRSLQQHPESNLTRDDYPAVSAKRDTRGFILYRQGKLQEALKEMDVAVLFAEQAQPDLLRAAQAEAVDARHRERLLHKSRMPLAVMYYHRALVREAIREVVVSDGDEIAEALLRNLSKQAEEDRQRVRDLGYTPDETLF